MGRLVVGGGIEWVGGRMDACTQGWMDGWMPG